MKTGVSFDCPCGATGVPMGWGWKSLVHEAAKPFSADAARRSRYDGTRCGGPDDLFGHMLRNAELAVVSPIDGDGGYFRECTDAEIRRDTAAIVRQAIADADPFPADSEGAR